MLQCKFQLKSPIGLGEVKSIFKMVAVVAILDSSQHDFRYFHIY